MKQKANKRLAQNADIGFKLRIWRTDPKRKQSGKFLLKCGDCNKKVEIFFGDKDNFIEINGVCASKKEWAKILLPLLK